MPKESNYRITTEKLISERKGVVESTPDPADIEKKYATQCEELIEAARAELEVIEMMQKYKPWEPLQEKPQPDQWKWPL